jgi:choline kinase
MKYVIMAAGNGKRWNNYLGVPKHLIKINNETLLERTTRLLKENDVYDFVITGSDERYSQYGELIPQTKNDCEIDRFEESIINDEVCYLYGDVYYTEKAIKIITNTKTKDIVFFGSEDEIFAVKIKNINLFLKHKRKVKELFLENKINRCIGWEIYRSINNIPFDEHIINKKYVKILDGTDDIDYPEDYEKFKSKWEVKK